MKKLLELRYWAIALTAFLVGIPVVAHQQQRAAKKYRDHRAEYCSALVGPAEQKKACIEEHTNADDYLPWGYELFRWPEGITTWAIIGTGFVIAWQSNETRKAAIATRDSVRIAQTSLRVTRNKEKPRFSITIESEDLDAPKPSVTFAITCRCPTPAYSCSGNAVCLVRTKGDHAFPEVYRSIGIPSIIETSSAYHLIAPIIGEGGINSMSIRSRDRFENCEVQILFCVHIFFEDVYGKRDFMFSRVLEASGLKNFDGTQFRCWVDGPVSLNWDKEYDEDQKHPDNKLIRIKGIRPVS